MVGGIGPRKHDLDERMEHVRHDLVASLALKALARLRGLDAEAIPRELLRLRDLLTGVLEAPRRRLLLGMEFSYLAATSKVDPEVVHTAVRTTLPKRTAEVMLNPLEKYVEERVAKAVSEAVSNAEAQAEARAEARGMSRGRGAGQLELLRAQLEKRFGPIPADALERLRRATPAELETMGLRLLDAKALADVFA